MTSSNGNMPSVQPPAALRSRERQLAPFEWYAKMRQEAPVHYDEQRKVWDVFGYEDVDRVLTDYELFTSDMVSTEAARFGDDEDHPFFRTMISADPPEHGRLRGFVADRFSPGMIREYRPRIEAVAAEFIDRVADANRIDIVDDFAYPLPVTVIAELLGIPSERRDQFKAWSDTLIARPSEDTKAAVKETQTHRKRAKQEMREYFSTLLDERADSEDDDLVTLTATTDELTREEKTGFCTLLLLAGNVTTTNLITNAVWCFEEQGVTDAVRTGAVDRTQAIEEVLRYRSPVQALRRTTTDAVEIGGQRIDAGEVITAWIGSANRDSEIFDAAAEFRPERSPNPHIAFGKGIHYCLGASLARIEADIALKALLDQFEVLSLEESEKTPLKSLYGVKELPCRVESGH